MRLKSVLVLMSVFSAAALAAVVAAIFAARAIEDSSVTSVRAELDKAGLTWADVDAAGLQVFLIGTAPTEAAQFDALSAAGRIVDAARVIDQMDVQETQGLTPPRFSVEILRNESGISLIGLIPRETNREELLQRVQRRVGRDIAVSDLLEEADFETPEGWDDALRYALDALEELPRSKISVAADQVSVKAMTQSVEARRQLETDLARRAPDNLRLALDLSAPRPVITPFTLRFLIDGDGPRFDACSADTEASRNRILSAASAAGLAGKATCTLGLGVPSPRWAEAVEMSIAALAELGGGALTFADADIALLALEGTDRDVFDRVIGELEPALPPVFALNAVLPETPDETDEGPPEFVATLSPEGEVQLRGRIASEIARQTADSYARASFGSGRVYTAARVDDSLPGAWSVRVLAALEVLSQLSNGAVTVTPDSVSVRGNTGFQDATAEISRILAEKLGEAGNYSIDVTYQEKLDPTLGIPSPEQCEAQIVEIIGDRKITFEPGSATLDASAKDILDEVAELLTICGDIPLEIAGHTDSQGRESMNQQLSQSRAQSVLNALRERRVLTASYRATGYGEMSPIASNDSEAGREANRRIEFRLIRAEPIPETETTLESVEQDAGQASAPEADAGAEGETDEQD